jgi:hypothetical protein
MNNRTILDNLDISSIDKESKLFELIQKLNSFNTYNSDIKLPNSIMVYGNLCDHDDGFLCECRLQYIIDFIETNFKEKE